MVTGSDSHTPPLSWFSCSCSLSSLFCICFNCCFKSLSWRGHKEHTHTLLSDYLLPTQPLKHTQSWRGHKEHTHTLLSDYLLPTQPLKHTQSWRGHKEHTHTLLSDCLQLYYLPSHSNTPSQPFITLYIICTYFPQPATLQQNNDSVGYSIKNMLQVDLPPCGNLTPKIKGNGVPISCIQCIRLAMHVNRALKC